jgi:hypothetical protein
MTDETGVVAKTLRDAFESKSNAEELLANPAVVFRRNGLNIPVGDDEGFNSYFNEVAGSVVTRLRETDEQRLSADHEELLAERGIGCTACKISVYAVALAIVGVGAAGLAFLTVESAPVVALATFAGVSARAALAFIRGLGAAVAKGVSDVATRICRWTGTC